MKNIKIYGAGGHSRVIIDLAECLGYTVTKVFDDFLDQSTHSNKDGIPDLCNNKEEFFSDNDPLIIAIGNNNTRADLAKRVKSQFGILVHPSAVVSSYSCLGSGTVVNCGGIVQAGTTVGKHVIINTGAVVDHDNIIGDFVHISPNVSLTGHVEIGEGTHIGAGAVVIPKVKVGKWCVIGAGAIIIRDVPDFSVVVGNPGRIIKTVCTIATGTASNA